LIGYKMAEAPGETVGQCKNRHKNELRNFKKEWDVKIKKAKGKQKKELKKEKEAAEQELKDKQAKELEALQSGGKKEEDGGKEEEVAANPMAVQANTGPKKETKAMKRRRKKEERERQELAQIEEEKKNMVDHKGIEIRKIQNKLGLGWICKHIEADGHCLFRAVADQLKDPTQDFAALRQLCRSYMDEHRDDFSAFIAEDDGDNFDDYLDKLVDMKDVLWGGQLEINALANGLKRKIVVYKADGDPHEAIPQDGLNEEEEPIRLSYHLHYMGLGEHYNSLVKMF